MNPSVCAPCSLNHESELIRTVTSAASRPLSTSPSSFAFAVRPELHALAEPVMTLRAGRQRVDLVEARRVLVAHDEIRLVALNRAVAHEQVVAARRTQRLGEQQAALQVVDVVVDGRRQVDDARDEPRRPVAILDAHALGAGQEVLTLQEVQRAASAAKLLAARDRAGLGREAVDREAPLAEARRALRLVVQLRAVEPAVDLRELVVHVADLEVAPLAVALVAPDLHVELAERRRHLLDRAVVAERREVVVGIDAAEQRVRRLVEEVAEEILERRVARVGARREPPALVELAVQEEREPRVGRGVEVGRAVLALQQLDRTVRSRCSSA